MTTQSQGAEAGGDLEGLIRELVAFRCPFGGCASHPCVVCRAASALESLRQERDEARVWASKWQAMFANEGERAMREAYIAGYWSGFDSDSSGTVDQEYARYRAALTSTEASGHDE